MAYATSGMIGVSLADVTAGTTTDGVNALYALGTVVTTSDGGTYIYCQAGAAITQYMTVAIDENFQAVPVTHALMTAGLKVGFAQVGFSDNDLGWICVNGENIQALLLINCGADVPLYTQATAGYLDDASVTSSVKLDGVVNVLTITASGASEILATWPRSATI